MGMAPCAPVLEAKRIFAPSPRSASVTGVSKVSPCGPIHWLTLRSGACGSVVVIPRSFHECVPCIVGNVLSMPGRRLALPSVRRERRPYGRPLCDLVRTDAAGVRSAFPPDLEQEPGPTFGFVGPCIDQSRRGVVARVVSRLLRAPQGFNQAEIVRPELREHVAGLHEGFVIVLNRLPASDVADRSKGCVAGLARSLRDGVRRSQNLAACSSRSRW